MDPVRRAAFQTDTLGKLIDVLAGSLQNAYLVALGFAIFALILATRVPRGLRPTH